MNIAIQSRVVSPDDALRDTIVVANRACQDVLDTGLRNQTWKKADLHRATYKDIRERYPMLNSSIVTAVRDQAADMLKRLKLKKGSQKRLTSGVRLNHNTLKVFFDSSTVSLSTVAGRRKYDISIPTYARERYTLGQCTSATLRIDKRKRVMLDLIIEVEGAPLHTGNIVMGVDRGIYHPAVTSHNQFFNSKHLRNVKARYRHLKRCLQQAGTRSATRHLKRVAGRERRFVLDTNHCISKRIVAEPCDVIAMEELEVSKMKVKKGKHKSVRRLLGSWSPTQLQTFVSYKAALAGKRVVFVKPHYTSQCCNRCGHIESANRHGRLFQCLSCGFSLHADLNASRNIASLGKSLAGRQPVNLPNATHDELKAFFMDDLRASVVASSPFLTGSN